MKKKEAVTPLGVRIHLTPEEHKKVSAAAGLEGTSMKSFCHEIVMRAVDQVIHEKLKELKV